MRRTRHNFPHRGGDGDMPPGLFIRLTSVENSSKCSKNASFRSNCYLARGKRVQVSFPRVEHLHWSQLSDQGLPASFSAISHPKLLKYILLQLISHVLVSDCPFLCISRAARVLVRSSSQSRPKGPIHCPIAKETECTSKSVIQPAFVLSEPWCCPPQAPLRDHDQGRVAACRACLT